ncbi:MAG: cytochrome c oxidase assembly factor 1 family protein [Roseiflexus sp.]|nr:cytochrome c oxidase assembly factor 1 family protein [Roseiflexus sp.]MCS7289619.1 cytochrome c oxidase assembly factor 1 family protein [Roseiflexus sp.]MDW8146362.1 cytochrome c oxidase assembly factor Coa1 family protein [Roseiflexaceae bacterium]MDW8233194.1 cytochrome c oxidase assembly factor Coa1 family protein [Roseiflexaceae bacterium]
MSARLRGCTPLSCLVGITIVVLVGACIGGIFFAVIGSIRTSDVVQGALARAERDPEVAAALGAPLEVGWLPTGSIRFSNGFNSGSGDANLTLPISGPRGSGEMIVEAVRRNGMWRYSRLIVAVGNRRIDVLREQ